MERQRQALFQISILILLIALLSITAINPVHFPTPMPSASNEPVAPSQNHNNALKAPASNFIPVPQPVPTPPTGH